MKEQAPAPVPVPVPAVAPLPVPGAPVAATAVAAPGTNNKNYKGFVAGVFSGIAKLSGAFSSSPLTLPRHRLTPLSCD